MALQPGIAQPFLAAPQPRIVELGVVHAGQAKPGVEAARATPPPWGPVRRTAPRGGSRRSRWNQAAGGRSPAPRRPATRPGRRPDCGGPSHRRPLHRGHGCRCRCPASGWCPPRSRHGGRSAGVGAVGGWRNGAAAVHQAHHGQVERFAAALLPLLADDLLAGSQQRGFSCRQNGRARQPCPCRLDQLACSRPEAALWRHKEAVKP